MLYQKDEIAKFLMDRRPSLINRTYEGYNYFGESPCHIAVCITNGMLRRLIAKGADVHNPRATGKFFKPSGTLYFGETVLAFAACMGHVDIVHYLIEKVGVDPNQIDHQGNNVLHVLAFWGYFNDTRGRSPSREEYRTYHKHSELGGIYLYLAEAGADDTLANLSGMTPLQVAVWRGHVEMVNAMLNKKRQCMWTFGKASSWMYDLSEIDTFVDPVMMNHTNGAMEIAIQQKNRDVLNLPLFQRLLEAKWISYGRRMFYFNFIRSFIYYLLLTACIYFVPNGYDYYSSLIPDRSRIDYFNTGAIGIVRLVIEIALVASNVYTAADELESMRKLKMDYFTGPGARENMSQWLNLGFMGVAIAARIARNSDVENIFLGFHAMLGWISMMNYSVGFQQLGTLWLIFIKIVTGDLVRFIVLLSVFIIGFGEALWLQMGPYASYYYHMNRGDGSTTPTTTAMITPSPTSGFSNASDDTVATTVGAVATATAAVVGRCLRKLLIQPNPLNPHGQVMITIVGLTTGGICTLRSCGHFRILMQQGDYDDYRNPRNSWFSMILFMVLFFTLMILLLNVFLALLNQTFSKIMEDTEKQWRMIKAQLILSLDEAMLGEYYDDLRNGKDEPSPVCRIGFPRPQQNFMSDGDYERTHEKAANIQTTMVQTDVYAKVHGNHQERVFQILYHFRGEG
ncbi:hypothetical protein BC829DRAFT_63809 [Chytridium lagenaria]|nr:hypothetical protein BC829DRAFT_63809 [Chytridium lagenaria]